MAAAATNCRSWREGSYFSEAAEGAMTDSPSEARWSTERRCGGKGIIIGWGKCGINHSDFRLVRGGSVLWRWRRKMRKGDLEKIVSN